MSARPWTEAEEEIIQTRYGIVPVKEIAAALDRSVASVRSRAKVLGVKGSRRYWTPEQQEVLRRRYADTDNRVLSAELGMSISSIWNQAERLGLHKSPDYLRDMGRRIAADLRARGITRGQFPRGHRPWNKGLRRELSPRRRPTQFKPGNRPHSWQPIGHERLSKEGYLERKVTDEGPKRYHFKLVHRLVWEAAHGPIPRGHAVAFRDRGPRDRAELITLDRLELVTRAELMRRNSRHRYPEDINQAITWRARLTRVLNEKTRQLTPETDP